MNYILVDHDNFSDVPPAEVITSWVHSCRETLLTRSGRIANVVFRAYGGWFRDQFATEARYAAANYYQQQCPALLKAYGLLVRVHFEFADRLILASHADPHITHTVSIRRSKPRASSKLDCQNARCQLKDVQRWMGNSRACTEASCAHRYIDYFERNEQKQVDVHIATDLLSLASSSSDSCICLVSDDVDFSPALLAASIHNGANLSVIRSHTKTYYCDTSLENRGVLITSIGGQCASH